jgi:hypothetical protein
MIWQDTATDLSLETFDEKDKSMSSSFATTMSGSVWSSSANQNNIAQNVSSSSSMSNRITDSTTIKTKPTAAKENIPLTNPDGFGRASSQAENQLLPPHTSSSSAPAPSLGSGSVRFTSGTVSPPRTSNSAPTTSKTSTPPGSAPGPSRPRKSLAEATSMLFGDFDMSVDASESYMLSTPPARTHTSILSSSAWLNSVYTSDNTPDPATSTSANANGKGSDKGSDAVAASLLQKLMKETRESAAAAQRGGGSQNRIIDMISAPSYTTFSAPTYMPMPGDKDEVPRSTGEIASCAPRAFSFSLSLSLYLSLCMYGCMYGLCMDVYVYMFVCMYVCMYVHTHVCVVLYT